MSDSPNASSEAVLKRMQNTSQRDTPAEMQLRRELHRRGFRYRVDRPIPGVTRGRPDLLFLKERVAVFVDGCFWHSCPEHATLPRQNREWWIEKLEANVARDRRHDQELREAGWTVLRYWEHDDLGAATDQVIHAVTAARASLEE